jgi:hypothetical protein
MRRLNRNRVKTNQIGQYTLKINSIILKLQKLSLSGEQNVAAGKKNGKGPTARDNSDY